MNPTNIPIYESHVEIEDEDRLLAYLDRYIKIENKCWKGKDRIGISRKPNSLGFHREFLTSLSPKKSVSFWFLTGNMGDLACLIAYHHGNTLYMAHTTFDSEYHALSPGMIATKGLLEYACGHDDIDIYDPLATPVDQGRPRHKTVWATHRDPIETRSITIYNDKGLIELIGRFKKSRVFLLAKHWKTVLDQKKASE